MSARAFVLVLVALALSVAACGSSSKSGAGVTAPTPTASDPVPYPAPSNPMALTQAAGLVPEPAEQLKYHVHAHLDVFIDGKHIIVPAGIGIDITNPGVHEFTTDGMPSYGGISVPCDKPCISPLHTHDVSGVVHTESPTHEDNTLGQFFTEWGVRLDANCFATYCQPTKSVAIYVDGKKFTGDPRPIPLSDKKEIAVIVGKPPAQIPDKAF